jgi:fucose permease
MTLLQPMTVASLLATGMGVALLGSIKVPLARRLAIDEARVGGLVSIFGFTMIPVMLTIGFATDLLDKGTVLIGGSVLMAVSLGLLAQSNSYGVTFAAVLLLGAAWSGMVNVVNVIALAPITFSADTPFASNLANVFFGMGAFLTPLAVSALLRRISFVFAVSLLCGLALVPAVLALGVDFSPFSATSAPTPAGPDTAKNNRQNNPAPAEGKAGPAKNPPASHGVRTLLTDPLMWLCALALFFYGPLEATMGAWTTTYLGDKGIREATASSLLSGFWLSFMAARLITAFSLPARGEAVLILVLALACVAVLVGVLVSRAPAVSAGMVLGAGLIFGPIFPTLIAILLGHFDPAVHGRAVGLLFAIGGVGWTVIPILIGAYARRTSVQRGFAIAAGSAVGLCVVAVGLLRVW